jgi:hypothetical protein
MLMEREMNVYVPIDDTLLVLWRARACGIVMLARDLRVDRFESGNRTSIWFRATESRYPFFAFGLCRAHVVRLAAVDLIAFMELILDSDESYKNGDSDCVSE